MKRLIFFLLAFCAISLAHAQSGSFTFDVQNTTLKVQKEGPLSRDGKIYYYHGQPMTEKEMVEFVKKDCSRAYNHYQKWRKIEITGWSLLGVGGGMVIIGSGCLAGIGDSRTQIATSMSFYAIGAITGIVGITLGSVGHVKKINTHKVYNTWCGYNESEQNQAKATPLELKLTAGSNGLGLAMTF